MTESNANKFDAFCRAAFDFLNGANVRYLVVGGLAVVVIGEPRMTADVDVIAYLSQEGAENLVQHARAAGFDVDVALEIERLRATGTLRFKRTPFQLDIILASLPFEQDAMSRSTQREIFGCRVSFPTPEDLILFKVLAGRDKDMLDAVGIAKRHIASLDWAYIEAIVQELCDAAEDMSAWHRLEIVRHKAH